MIYVNHIGIIFQLDIDECIDLYLLTKEWEDYQHNQIFDDKKKKIKDDGWKAHEFINQDRKKRLVWIPKSLMLCIIEIDEIIIVGLS